MPVGGAVLVVFGAAVDLVRIADHRVDLRVGAGDRDRRRGDQGQCGACVGDCPATTYGDEFNPREVMLKVLYGLGDELIKEGHTTIQALKTERVMMFFNLLWRASSRLIKPAFICSLTSEWSSVIEHVVGQGYGLATPHMVTPHSGRDSRPVDL